MENDSWRQTLAIKADIFKVKGGAGGDGIRGGGAAGSCAIACCAVAKVRSKGFAVTVVAAIA